MIPGRRFLDESLRLVVVLKLIQSSTDLRAFQLDVTKFFKARSTLRILHSTSRAPSEQILCKLNIKQHRKVKQLKVAKHHKSHVPFTNKQTNKKVTVFSSEWKLLGCQDKTKAKSFIQSFKLKLSSS